METNAKTWANSIYAVHVLIYGEYQFKMVRIPRILSTDKKNCSNKLGRWVLGRNQFSQTNFKTLSSKVNITVKIYFKRAKKKAEQKNVIKIPLNFFFASRSETLRVELSNSLCFSSAINI